MRRLSLIVLMLWIPLAGGCQRPARSYAAALRAPQVAALAGARAAPRLESDYGSVLRDAAAEIRMMGVGSVLANQMRSELSCEYRLLGSADVNAFSLPPGRVYITRGLYEQLGDPALLAAVVAHELAHLEAADSLKARGSSAEMLARESAADIRGAEILAQAGFDPAAMTRLVHLVAPYQPADWAAARLRILGSQSVRAQHAP